MPREGYTYRIVCEGKEVERFHCVRVHGRRIQFAMTPFSSLTTQVTRLRWKKMAELLAKEGVAITEEPSHDPR